LGKPQAKIMILIGLGSNIGGPWGNPHETVKRALAELDAGGIAMKRASRLLVSRPFGKVNQPPFVNAVAEIATHMPPEALLRRLHAIERQAGRRRGIRWGPRSLDLDLLDYHGLRRRTPPILPHPGIAERSFVLGPIAEIVPSWKHPVLRLPAAKLMCRLRKAGQGTEI
jgi:2-amino-4-hydroxy-6-hydroxymethyldihydropteridine diphosphokinase